MVILNNMEKNHKKKKILNIFVFCLFKKNFFFYEQGERTDIKRHHQLFE